MKKTSKQLKQLEKSAEKIPQSPEMKRIEGFLKLMNTYGVNELDLEDKGSRIHVRMQSGSAPTVSHSMVQTPAWMNSPSPVLNHESSAPSLKDSAPVPAPLASNQKKMLSPFVGTFYRSSNPNSEPYAKEGQSVRKGQTLCIIEAMKLMNEIESDFEGKIISALVENGQPVEFGEPLFIIEV